MSSKKKNKSKKNKSAPKDFDALKIPENNGDVEALITATNAGDIQWGRAASQKLPVPQPSDQSHALTKIAEDAAKEKQKLKECSACGKNCLFARGDASCCPEYKQHNGVRLDHADAAPKPIEEVLRLKADGASVFVTGKKQRQPGDGSCNYHSLSAELRRLPGFS